jgi:hypothetical protein
VIRQHLLPFAPIAIVSRHVAQFALIGFCRRLVCERLEWDYDLGNQEIVTSDAMLGAKLRNFLISSHVIADQHRENSLRPRLPLTL